MKLFNNYLNGLDEILARKVTVTPQLIRKQREFSQKEKFQKAINESAINEGMENVPSFLDGPKILFDYDKDFIEKKFGKNTHSFEEINIGPHPDFRDLGEIEYINHYCVSMFIDIKGSTKLIEKYSLLEVRLIKDSLLTLSIQVANQFGGHIHRLQGDGIFLQFVRRGGKENDSIINALNTASILTQFVSKDLANNMEQYGLKPLKIRIGIDFGPSDKVLWSHYGIPGCSELTTTSLHTDMAAKLQSKAYDNSILIGDNIKEKLDLKKEFYSFYESQDKKEQVYYISRQFTYKFYVFNWQEYLLSLPYMGKNSDGKTIDVKEERIHIECYISDENGNNNEKYFPNSRSIPKDKKVVFKLMNGNVGYAKQGYERIEWRAFNSGKQALDANLTEHDFNKSNNNKTICATAAAYLGHHYVECKIIKDNSASKRITFPIFVQ